jgi:SAM-dependent methyltransferase
MTRTQPNAYTDTWFELFLAHQDTDQTAREVAFLQRNLPQPEITSVLDVCCGYGRHAGSLAKAGYRVLGIDRDPQVIARARMTHASPTLSFQVHDMTRLAELRGPFDAVICMWQSFGYHDAATNADVLRQMARLLPIGGTMVLDIYNRDFFERRQGTRASDVHGVEVATTQRIAGNRLLVDLEYQDRQQQETFDWQVFALDSIVDLAASTDLELVVACTSFEEQQPPNADQPRMQLVFSRRSSTT